MTETDHRIRIQKKGNCGRG